jgi:hypothetical protein
MEPTGLMGVILRRNPADDKTHAADAIQRHMTSASGWPDGYTLYVKFVEEDSIVLGQSDTSDWTVMTDKKPCPEPRPVTDSATDELSTR